jgi:hypothetical protein
LGFLKHVDKDGEGDVAKKELSMEKMKEGLARL